MGNGRLDDAQVHATLGGVPFEQRVAVLEAAAGEDVAGVLVGVHEMMVAGHDSRRVADDLLRTLRDAFLCANAGERVPYDGPAAEAAQLADLAQRMGNVALVRGIEVLGQAIVDIRGQAITDPRLVLEVAVVRLARRESRTREETLLDRIERLEKQVGGGGTPIAAAAPRCRNAATRLRAPAPATRTDTTGPMLAARAPAAKAKPAARAEPAAPVAAEEVARGGAGRRRADDRSGARRRDRSVAGRARLAEGARARHDPGSATDRDRARRDRLRRAAQSPRSDQRPVPAARRPRSRKRSRRDSVVSRSSSSRRTTSTRSTRSDPSRRPRPRAVDNSEPPPDEHIDLDDLTDAPDAPPPDPTARLVEGLGAQVVEEHSRD